MLTCFPPTGNVKCKNTGPPREMKCKTDIGAGSNLMSPDDYKKVNPSEFDQ